MRHYRVVRDIEAEIARCNWCGRHTILIGGIGQCEKGCPGYFINVRKVMLSKEGVEEALKKASQRVVKKRTTPTG